MLGGVAQQVEQDLDDAARVGHYPAEFGRQVDFQIVPDAAGEEGAAGRFDEPVEADRLGPHREFAGFDPGHVEQVGNQRLHALGLLFDDPQELGRRGRVDAQPGLDQGPDRAFDRAERGAQLVADHGQELGPHPHEVFERGQVLERDHDRLDQPVG